jgi:hypothetical protein
MRQLTKAEKEELLRMAQDDFPEDEMMQEIHYVRLLHHYQIRELPLNERIRFFETDESTIRTHS